jgi:hypothetical protein
MAHTVIDNKFYVDSDFLNSLYGIHGVSLEHMGFGEFYATTPMGTVDFDRMRGKDFPGQGGRSHRAYDREGYGTKATEWLIGQVESRGKSVRVARDGGDGLRSRLIRLAAAKPELRADLLPLLKEDADPASVDQNKPESYYGLPPRGVQAARREDPNRVVLMVTNSIVGPMVVNVTNRSNRKYAYDGSVEGLAATLQDAATASIRFQSMDFLDGPEINVVKAPRVPMRLADAVSSRAKVGPVYVALRGTEMGLEWVILPRAPKVASTRTASRYELPGREPGSMIAFGIDRAMGRYFQYWPDDEMPTLDKDFLDQGEIITLLKKHGKPSADLQRAVEAFALDLDPGLRGISASSRRRA